MGRIAALWGVTGVAVLLSVAIVRLSEIAIDSFGFGYDWRHWTLLALNVAFMSYTEGYRGFQLAFSPRTAARARHLRDHPTLVRTVLAPLFCMGFFHATRRRVLSAYLLTTTIVVLIVLFQHISQPWRGVLDAGVACGLLWGLVSVLWFANAALRAPEFSHSPELP